MKQFLTIAILICWASSLIAQVPTRTYYADKELIPREHPVDFKHLRLEIQLDTLNSSVKGTVNHSFTVLRRTVDSLFLDGPGIEVTDLRLDQKTTQYATNAKGITVYFNPPLNWDEHHQLEIQYKATPKSGIYFIGWNDPAGKSRKQIWTQGQGTDNRHWIPMYDSPNDKVTSEILVDFDHRYKVLSNGRKMSEKRNKNGTISWHYALKKPHATYLIMLGIGDYKIKESKSKSGVPLQMWYYPDWEDRTAATYRHTEDIMNFLEEETGVPYPWGSYAQIPVQDFKYGAMENTTATIFGDFYCTDERAFWDRNYVRVNAHEMAHQWFGNMVSARTSSHQWLQESFATHYDLTFQGIAFGKDHFNWERRKAQQQALAATKKDYKPVAHSSSGSVRHYPKGAHVLQMLKYVVGRESFNKAQKHFLKKHAYQNVDSEDLLIAFHETLGLSLDWFWEEWIYKGGEPHYKVEFQEMETEGKRYGTFDVKQVHDRNELVGLFDMPIFFEIHYKDGTKSSQKVRIFKEQQKVVLPLSQKVSYVLFDPNSEVMKAVSFEKPFSMLKEQALHGKHMIDRYDAIVAMKATSADQKREVLKEVFKNEQFHAVKDEIVAQLLYDDKSTDLIKKALSDPDPLVRSNVIAKTAFISADLLPFYEKLLTDSSYSVIEQSLHKLCFLFPSYREKYLEITERETGIYEKNIRVKWLEIASSLNDGPEYENELISYTSPSYEFRTRIAAAQALSRLNYFNEELLKNMVHASFSFNSRLYGPMLKVLDHYYQQSMYKKMIYDYVSQPGKFTKGEQMRLRKFRQF